ncbi:MAG: thiamine-phosphate kinase [Aquabacterium sp.]
MALGEFELIERFFKRAPRRAALGVGDDCALVPAPGPCMHWAITSDMLVEGRHFLSTVSPRRLGHKALAVNLSDLAACGATPRAFTLALALPRADADWLAAFAQGLFALADEHDIELVGGDTTAGPLNICITAFGEVPVGAALQRDAARPGDDIWVSGNLGDARLALEVFRGHVALGAGDFEAVRRAMEMPQPRVALGLALRGVAHAAIDISDGLVGDLGHVLARSGVGAKLHTDALPRSALLAQQPSTLQRLCLLSGGDDYELLVTAPAARRDAVLRTAAGAGVPVARVGCIEATPGLRLVDAQGQPVVPQEAGFDHFSGDGA